MLQSIMDEMGGIYSDLNPESAMAGFHIAYLGGVVVCLIVTVILWFILDTKLSEGLYEKAE